MKKGLLGTVSFIAGIMLVSSLIGCDMDGDGNGGNTGGTFTLTDIPSEYSGKYAYLSAYNGDNADNFFALYGAQNSTYPFTATRISDGSVSIPMWMAMYSGTETTITRYSGNHTFTCNSPDDIDGVFAIAIIDSVFATDGALNAGLSITFSLVAFSNGNATKSWNDHIIFF